MSEIIRPDRVIVHYKCCKCGATEEIPLQEGLCLDVLSSICYGCGKMENFMEIVGVSIQNL